MDASLDAALQVDAALVGNRLDLSVAVFGAGQVDRHDSTEADEVLSRCHAEQMAQARNWHEAPVSTVKLHDWTSIDLLDEQAHEAQV